MKSKELNLDIRKAIADKKICYYEVAQELGIRSETFSHMLQAELPADKKEKVLKAISDIKA